ncbi:MAG TPA: alpha-isopropylmalate synthase regulatory domain-containing protein, partial [Deltaproteobacteria bacterium]|nr:alpha-isopropylmalate synthase regulatory domain-containing protein [Deltaproteobacteria bacterium]
PGRYRGLALLADDAFNAAGPHSDDPAGPHARELRGLAPTAERWGEFKTPGLREVSRRGPYMHAGQFDDIANLSHNKHQPYVGEAAFAHKGGVHVSAVMGDPTTYEHISPDIVGNQRKVLVSEHSGRSNILYKAREFNIDLSKDDTTANEIVKSIKDLEDCGFQFEGADASLELLMKKAMGAHMRSFKLKGFRVNTERRSDDADPVSEATIMIEVDGNVEHTAALGNGPVNALDRALRKALVKFYPGIQEVELLDYKVRVISSRQGTESVVRVLIESGDKKDRWNTVGVSSNILEASWMALVDSMDYKLYKDAHKRGTRAKGR